MINRELLGLLRALNAATVELRRPGLGVEERDACARRIEDLRAPLPTALLAHHDRMAALGRESVAAVAEECCGQCHRKLPVGLQAELNGPGRIGVCPHCGVFLFNRASEPASSEA